MNENIKVDVGYKVCRLFVCTDKQWLTQLDGNSCLRVHIVSRWREYMKQNVRPYLLRSDSIQLSSLRSGREAPLPLPRLRK